MKKKQIGIIILATVTMTILVTSLWAQVKKISKPKAVFNSPTVLYTKKSTKLAIPPITPMSGDGVKQVRQISDAARLAAVNNLRKTIGKKKRPNLPPVEIRLSPAHPIQGKSHILLTGGSTSLTDVATGRNETGYWFLHHGAYKLYIKLDNMIAGKTYLVNVSGRCERPDDKLRFLGAMDITTKFQNNQILVGFTAESDQPHLQITTTYDSPVGCLINQVQFTRVD